MITNHVKTLSCQPMFEQCDHVQTCLTVEDATLQEAAGALKLLEGVSRQERVVHAVHLPRPRLPRRTCHTHIKVNKVNIVVTVLFNI